MLKSRFNLKTVEPNDELGEEEKMGQGGATKKTSRKEKNEEVSGEHHVAGEYAGEATPRSDIEEYTAPIEERFVRKLNKSEISTRLSMIGKIGEGDGYSYLKLNCTGMKLTELTSIKHFKHLQFVNVSKNLLTTEALQPVMELPFLILLHADANVATSAKLKKGKYLQVLMLNHNRITSVYEVFHPHLATLEVGSNKIEEAKFQCEMSELKSLSFRDNLIKDISHFEFSHLLNLYVASNQIKSLIGLEKMPNLRMLHVRNNPIKNLDGFTSALTNLHYVNLRNCKVSRLFQIKKLRVLPALDTLIIKNCPYMGGSGKEILKSEEPEEDPALRIEVIAALLHLKRLNKQNVTPDERSEAKETMKQWIEDGERDEEEELEEEIIEEQTEISEEDVE